MPTTLYTVTTTEQSIPANKDRTVLVIQNVHASNVLSISDQAGSAVTSGIQLGTQYASLTLRRSHGEEPQKQWFMYASAAGTTVRVLELFGEPITAVEPEPEPTPQQLPIRVDAPRMRLFR